MIKMLAKILVLMTLMIFGLAEDINNTGSTEDDLRQARIQNGDKIDIRKAPYTVFVKSEEFATCVGAIISRQNVLTAAHCTRGDIKKIRVRSGSTFRNKEGFEQEVLTVHRHQNFSVEQTDGVKSYNDIAVIHVKTPFNYSDTTQAIQLFKKGQARDPKARYVLTGWGLSEFGDYPVDLRKLDMRLVSTQDCNKFYKNWGGLEQPSQFCAKNPNKKKYGCYGDSGGPLVYDNQGVKQLAGVNIYGGSCEIDYSPSVFSDVSFYRPWIDQHVQYDVNQNPAPTNKPVSTAKPAVPTRPRPKPRPTK